MAQIRALEWGEPEYWQHRIAGYLTGNRNPQQALPPRACFVAQDGDEIVGFVAGHLTTRHDCDGEIQWIAVLPKQRGKGIGSGLLRPLVEWFVSQDAHRVCVDLERFNTVARAFCARHGAEELNPRWLVWEDIGCVLHGAER